MQLVEFNTIQKLVRRAKSFIYVKQSETTKNEIKRNLKKTIMLNY